MVSAGGRPRLLLNGSPSVPVGLYGVISRAPAKGELAVVRLDGPARALAAERGYLPAGVLLIKPVAAEAGDIVCRHGSAVTLNGREIAQALDADVSGRQLPRWSGCVVLGVGQVFVLSGMPGSFDSRYFGAVDGSDVVGTGRPLVTAPDPIVGRARTFRSPGSG